MLYPRYCICLVVVSAAGLCVLPVAPDGPSVLLNIPLWMTIGWLEGVWVDSWLARVVPGWSPWGTYGPCQLSLGYDHYLYKLIPDSFLGWFWQVPLKRYPGMYSPGRLVSGSWDTLSSQVYLSRQCTPPVYHCIYSGRQVVVVV